MHLVVKYSGHTFAPDFKDDSDMERELRALWVRVNMIFGRGESTALQSVGTVLCTSLYTSSLWRQYTNRAYMAYRPLRT